ncbi:hypothetical protein RN001_008775 [Aquatica leii]|uniref:Peptidase S1 domain-containing protein n=1 Tax=Aquatica leii TaxID=1421715 RepID=A0AAN7PAR8_9COLE|nr:hypothetical protein RN001_008775 [Aquatica leii]
MVTLIVLLTITAITESLHNFADIPCGKQKLHKYGKVVGGQDALESEFPWLVSLTRKGDHFCGGSLITKMHVLSAGHCICSGSSFIPANQIRTTLGQYELTSSSSIKYEVGVKSVTLHPDYTCNKVRNDLAVLELEKQLEWSEHVQPACLPTSFGDNGYKRFEDVLATVAGWGNRLQKALVGILSTETCQQWYKSQGKKTKIQNTQICAGYEQGGVDSCWADSGGPLMVPSESGDQVIVVGVVSTGIGCARPFLPGLYSRVSDYITWIESVVKI